jgi:hypothetical protein
LKKIQSRSRLKDWCVHFFVNSLARQGKLAEALALHKQSLAHLQSLPGTISETISGTAAPEPNGFTALENGSNTPGHK